jgi:U3 small nucleolar RNA-associated protein 11
MVKQFYKGRAHKERIQPKARHRLGFLEKHADYIKRAQSYHENNEEYRNLLKAATQKHPDEFCFGMVKTETNEDGYHIVKEETLKGKPWLAQNSCNRAYLQTQCNIDKKKIEKLTAGLSNLDNAGKCNSRTVFVDSPQEGIALLRYNRDRLTRNPVQTISSLSAQEKLLLNQLKEKRYEELKERKKRSLTLKGLIDFLDDDKKLRSKGKRRRFRRPDGTQYIKWDPERTK